MDYIFKDGENWLKFLKALTNIACSCDVAWDSKSFSPRLKDTQKRGSEGLKEFKKHFINMKEMGIGEEHIDCFIDLVRCWRKTKVGRERTYDASWFHTLWGQYLLSPINKEQEYRDILHAHDMEYCSVLNEDDILPPTPYKISIGTDSDNSSNVSCCSDVPDDTKAEAVILLIKALDLNTADKKNLIYSVVALL